MRASALMCVAALFALSIARSALADEPAAAAIRKHRMGELRVRAEPGARVTVTQVDHDFWFGTAIARKMFRPDADPDRQRRYLHILRKNFNSAVHENALKWKQVERHPGRMDYADADRMLRWCEDNGLRMRGHCIFWAVPRHVQDWVKELDDEQLRAAVERRARHVTSRYRGRILEYDVNNEMVHGSFYADRLGREIRRQMFEWARTGDPDAPLYVNDYSILTGRHLERYERQIRQLLEAGVPLGGIGCQGHFWDDIDMQAVRDALDRLARFNLPIRITEFDITTDDEQKKARLVEDFYRTCFAHPAVDGILMWGFWEGAHWRPQAALWKRDFSPTPAAQAYQRLVFQEWWTRWDGHADAEGRCTVPAFYGRHRVTAGDRTATVHLARRDGQAVVDMIGGGN